VLDRLRRSRLRRLSGGWREWPSPRYGPDYSTVSHTARDTPDPFWPKRLGGEGGDPGRGWIYL